MNPIKKIIFEYAVPILGRIYQSKNKYCNVIYYHDIVNGQGHSYMRTNIAVFKHQMRYLVENGYETMRFDDLDHHENFQYKQKRVLITFDDGWKSNYTNIFEFMQSLGLKYNVFLATGLIDCDPNYLTWEQVKEMHKSGLCGFGMHTHSHVDISDISRTDFELEIVHANKLFEQFLGFQPLDFCYPFGKYSSESNIKLIRETPYKRLYTSDMVYSYEYLTKFIMGRNAISNNEAMRVFRHKLEGLYNIFSLLKK